MTDLTPEDLELAEAKRLAAEPPQPIPEAADLPDDVRDGSAEDKGDSPNHYEGD